jgi:protease YdgD
MPGILGRDDRVIVDSSAWPWVAIGRVNFAGRGFCTGTLVASNLVVTAAHCLFDKRSGRWYRPQELTFLAGYRRGEATAVGRPQSFVISPGFVPTAQPSLSRIASDWAVLVLRTPLAVAPMPVQALVLESETSPDVGPNGRSRILCAGYGQDRAHLLSIHTNCEISERLAKGNVLIHTCDTTRGGSGSPLIAETADGHALIGIATGHLKDGETTQSFAVHAEIFLAVLADLSADRR